MFLKKALSKKKNNNNANSNVIISYISKKIERNHSLIEPELKSEMFYCSGNWNKKELTVYCSSILNLLHLNNLLL